jgi:hypothetical protein
VRRPGERRFYIEAVGHTPNGEVCWWKPDRSGYTTNIDEAGLYSTEEARSIVKMRPGKDRAWREYDVITLATRRTFILAPMPPKAKPEEFPEDFQ